MKIIEGKDLVNMKFIKTEDGLLKEYKPQGRFIPKYDEDYWHIDDHGRAVWTKNNNGETDKYTLSHNLVFMTKEECKDYKWFLDKLDEYKTDFTLEEWVNKNIKKYAICINYHSKTIHTTFNSYCRTSCFHYFTKENVDKFIEEVGEDRIKKYMFNIWE